MRFYTNPTHPLQHPAEGTRSCASRPADEMWDAMGLWRRQEDMGKQHPPPAKGKPGVAVFLSTRRNLKRPQPYHAMPLIARQTRRLQHRRQNDATPWRGCGARPQMRLSTGKWQRFPTLRQETARRSDTE